MPQFSLTEHRKVRVLEVVGELQHGCCDPFRSALDAAAEAAGDEPFIVDLTGLRHIGSAGIRALMLLKKRLDKNGQRLILAGMADPVRETIEISGVDGLFDTDDTVAAALERVCVARRRNGARQSVA